VYDVRDILADPQYTALGTAVSVPDDDFGAVRMQNVPFRMSATPGAIRHAGRSHGRDTVEVLTSLGYTAEEIQGLRERGVI
jgi:crotonobetainyl-CoA:carnitine CoA-transferase CaiB-like acyl-CoA transferase